MDAFRGRWGAMTLKPVIVSLAGLLVMCQLARPQCPPTLAQVRGGSEGRVRPGDTLVPALFTVIRSSNRLGIEALLKRGVSVNSRWAGGTTPLIYAAIVADLATMQSLLDHGADVNAHDDAGATALMWSVGDPAKLSLLTQHHAEVDACSNSGQTALLIAANLAQPEEAVRLLLEKGADAKYSNRGYTALMGAAEQGSPEAVRGLLAHGANVKSTNSAGWTALHGGAMSGNPDVVRLLLDAGADPNATAKEIGHGMTPLHWAAASGNLATVRLLIERGARIDEKDSFNQAPPLLWAIAGDRGTPELIRFLLSKGADPDSHDRNGETALVWARRRGEPGILAQLMPAGNTEAPLPARISETPLKRIRLPRDAIQKSLPLLGKSADAFLKHISGGCVSCHHQALPIHVLRTAEDSGLAVDADWIKRQGAAVQEVLVGRRERLLAGMGLPDRLDAGYDLFALEGANVPPNEITDALVHYLTLKQTGDGRWQPTLFRPPINDSAFTATALAIKGLRSYAIPGRASELSARSRQAHEWLASHEPITTEDRTFQILGLIWSGERQNAVAKHVESLVQMQREDGGWSQLPTKASDAYATGEVLVSVLQSNLATRFARNIRRGIDFLLSTQQDDGSWFVESRSMPVQPYFDSGFPHVRSQFISCAATSWATLALITYDHQMGPSNVSQK
jgi:ankyrin repeat protein